MKKRALISVSDKTNIVEFSKFLIKNNYEIISTSGTFNLLKNNNIKLKKVSEFTKHEEILNGRVKTLHPKIHGGILANIDNKKHVKELSDFKIEKIDLVVVNLYPFIKTVRDINEKEENIIENIDIGGPTMLRSAAKNFKYTTVICDPEDYKKFQEEMKKNKKISLSLKKYLAGKAFAHTANYDSCINEYFKKINNIDWYKNDSIPLLNKKKLRYGENSHQEGLFFENLFIFKNSIFNTEQIHGKELSYNNIVDINAAINIILEYNKKPTVIALKHTNSCGLASDSNIEKAWDKCYEGDKISIFGGIIILNREVTKLLAEKMNKLFLEIIIAPNFSKEALNILKKKKNLRLLKLKLEDIDLNKKWKIKTINEGIIVQEEDISNWNEEFKNMKCLTKTKYNELEDLKFAWKAVKHIKSNGIVVTRKTQLIGIGTGQTNRISSVKLALTQNPNLVKNAILASDAFFPMADSIEEIAKYDVKAIIQPGGSIRDLEVIEACNKYNIAMYFIGKRHFLH